MQSGTRTRERPAAGNLFSFMQRGSQTDVHSITSTKSKAKWIVIALIFVVTQILSAGYMLSHNSGPEQDTILLANLTCKQASCQPLDTPLHVQPIKPSSTSVYAESLTAELFEVISAGSNAGVSSLNDSICPNMTKSINSPVPEESGEDHFTSFPLTNPSNNTGCCSMLRLTQVVITVGVALHLIIIFCNRMFRLRNAHVPPVPDTFKTEDWRYDAFLPVDFDHDQSEIYTRNPRNIFQEKRRRRQNGELELDL